MRYEHAFDEITDCILPRRKFLSHPEHWLVPIYFFGSRVGHRAWRMLMRSPLTVLWHGVKDGWREYR
jgi:hypothetical protein